MVVLLGVFVIAPEDIRTLSLHGYGACKLHVDHVRIQDSFGSSGEVRSITNMLLDDANAAGSAIF